MGTQRTAKFGHFGDMLKNYRKRSGMTRYALDRASGISHTAIQRIEERTRAGIPEMATVACLVGGLKGVSDGERLELLAIGTFERLVSDCWRAICYFAEVDANDQQLLSLSRELYPALFEQMSVKDEQVRAIVEKELLQKTRQYITDAADLSKVPNPNDVLTGPLGKRFVEVCETLVDGTVSFVFNWD